MKKRVVILSFYSGLVDRGVETWAKNLKKYLDNDFNIQILGGSAYGKKINWNKDSKRYWDLLALRLALININYLRKADIIVPTNGRLQVLFCRIISLIFGKPMIVFGHSGPGADDKWNLICSPNLFVAFSETQKKWVREHKLPWTKILVISHAVDTKQFTPAKRKHREELVLTVAANIPDKRIGLVKMAVEKLPKAKHLAVGKGNELEVSFGDMPKIYRKASLFCFVPQPWEAFGLVFLEAMSSGLPVVTVDDPIRREIVGDAGLFVKNPQNIKELSNTINKALKTKWGNRPRKQSEKFSWDKMAMNYRKLFYSYGG